MNERIEIIKILLLFIFGFSLLLFALFWVIYFFFKVLEILE